MNNNPNNYFNCRELSGAFDVTLNGKKVSLLPIEAFKLIPRKIFPKKKSIRYFLSSGTTLKQRSIARFSKKGFIQYQTNSVTDFIAIINKLGLFKKDIIGISLIPSTEVWHDSSLAQMISFFSKDFPVIYCSEKEFKQKVVSLNSSKKSIFLFGTAFHWVNLIDNGFSFQLPRQVFLVETGGTKGKSREISRSEFYDLLKTKFSLDQSQIISEYGSCELSCQAWDYLDKSQKNTKLENRWFHFSSRVKAWVLTEHLTLESSGIGVLTLLEANREDYPFYIKTEDVVQLNSNGSFRLIGRVKHSELKGCSLLAESSDFPKNNAILEPDNKLEIIYKTKGKISDKKIEDLLEVLHKLFSGNLFYKSLLTDLANKSVVDWCINDLKSSFLDTKEQYQKAILAIEKKFSKKFPLKWLFILPSSHPIAGFYPLIMAYLIGLKVWVRPSSRSDFASLNLFVQTLSFLDGFKINVIPKGNDKEYQDILAHCDGLLVYGEDRTINLFRKRFDGYLKGFGAGTSGTLVYQENFSSSLQKIIKDIFSLGQKGCLSSRFLVIVGNFTKEEKSKLVNLLKNSVLKNNLNIPSYKDFMDFHSIYQEFGKGVLRGFSFEDSDFDKIKNHPILLPWYSVNTNIIEKDVFSFFKNELFYPIYFVEEKNIISFLSTGLKDSSVKKMSLCEIALDKNKEDLITLGVLEQCSLGGLNITKINGMHIGENLF